MSALAGTGRLIRLALRRDRFVLVAWILGLVVFLAMATHMSVQGLPTQRDVVTETRFMAANPGMRLLSLSSGASVGAYAMSRSYLTLAILAAVMSILAVVRHTRQSEERGRDELLRAGVVGSAAGLVAGVTVALAVNAVLAPLLGLAMIANGQPAASSLATGAAIAAVGVAFTGIAAVTSQLCSTARAAGGIALACLAVACVVSGVGSMLGGVEARGVVAISAWPTWLSPIGWGFEMRPFGGDHWRLLVVPAVFTLSLIALAGRCASRRDLGAGVLPERTGRARASRFLLGPLGLAWRLQRSSFLAWLVGVLGLGLVFGSVTSSAVDQQGSFREWYLRMGAGSDVLRAFAASLIEMAGMLAAIYVVQALLRMREEEARGRLEPVLGAAVGRSRWTMSYVVTAVWGAAALLVTFAAAMALTSGLSLGDTSGLLREMTGAALAQVPAVLAIGGAVVALFALLPRWAAAASWMLVAAAILLSPVFGTSLGLPQTVLDVSPFTYQKAPAHNVSTVAVATLLAIAATLVVTGLAAFRSRDLASG